MSKEIILSPEEIVAIKEVIENKVGIDFAEFFSAYSQDPAFLEYRGGAELTEADLINDILDNGRLQSGDESSFEDTVIVGVLTIATPYGLI